MIFLEVHYIFCHINDNSGFNIHRYLVGIQVIFLKVTDNVLIDKIRSILEMESN